MKLSMCQNMYYHIPISRYYLVAISTFVKIVLKGYFEVLWSVL